MFLFSTILTAVVLTLCLLMCLSIVIACRRCGARSARRCRPKCERGTILVEAVHGMRTVKSLALDARQRHQFDVRSPRWRELRFDEGLTPNWIQTLMHPLEMTDAAASSRVAVYLAITTKDPVYVGAIFAFMLMSQRVAKPLLQAAQSIVQIDEARRAIAKCRRDRQPAGRGRPLGARHPHPDHRPDRVQRRDLPLSGRDVAGARPGVVRDPRGQRVRDRRAQRLGQDDRDPAAAGAAQRLPGADQDRRQRSARIRHRSSALQHRRRAAGEFPVPRHDPRDDRRRQARMPNSRRSSGRRGWPAPRSSSSVCPPATRPSSRRDRPTCPAASASGWRSRAR